jgi:hypothetical protein
VQTRSGHAVLKKDDRFLASSIDPVREARAWAQKGIANLEHGESIFVLGAGSGYHIKALCELHGRGTIFVIENDVEIAVAAQKLAPWSSDRVEVVVAEVATQIVLRKSVQDALLCPFKILNYGPSFQGQKYFFSAVAQILLGREVRAFLIQLEKRPELINIFDREALAQFRSQPATKLVSIKTLQKLFTEAQPITFERKIWKVLEELVQ